MELPSLQMVPAIPWMLPLNQMPCSHLLLHVTAHHRQSSEEWQESLSCHRGDSRRDKELSEGTHSPQMAVRTTGMLSWADPCPPQQRPGSYLEAAEDSVEVVESQDTVVDSQEAKEPGSANN